MQHMSEVTDNWNRNLSGKTVCNTRILNDNQNLVGTVHGKDAEFERLHLNTDSC